MKFLLAIDRSVAQILIFLILQLRPLLGPVGVCPFPIGCTQYGILQLQNNPVTIAIWHTTIRVLTCNPIYLWWHSKQIILQDRKFPITTLSK